MQKNYKSRNDFLSRASDKQAAVQVRFNLKSTGEEERSVHHKDYHESTSS